MLKQGISIPGIILIFLFNTLEPGFFFSLFDEKNKDLYKLFKENMVGGPSIIFHRYHEAGITNIREREMKAQGRDPKVCQKIVGFDANALYLYWHAHDGYLNKGKEFNEKRKKPMAELRQETEANSTYIKDLGYKLVEMWECE